jgi:glycerate kinase
MPDSFKGTMSSEEICEIMHRAIKNHYPACEVVSIPVADGGEGTVDSFLSALGGEKVTLVAKGPYKEDREGFYGILPDGAAVLEMAAVAGLPLAGEHPDPGKTTTYGVGQLLRDAVARGCKKIIIGLGGSATNDLGCGAAAAMGVKFYNADGQQFVPVGETLHEIVKIDADEARAALSGAEVIAMCDIDNPLYGKTGAAYVFGPQKGADAAMVETLDQNLRKASETIRADLSVEVSRLPGAGAAGGMGAGVVAFFGARLQMGIETVLDIVRFDDRAKDADLIFTGEGRIDGQSLRGKTVIGIGRRAKKLGVPAIAIVGDITGDMRAAYEEGLTGIFSINRRAVPFSEAKPHAKEDLFLTVDNLMRFLKATPQERRRPATYPAEAKRELW